MQLINITGATMDTVDTMFIHLLVREGTSPRSDLKVYISKHEDARSVVNTPTGLLKYWVRTLRMVDTHPTAFDSCCLMAIVFIVQADCCAPHQTRTCPLQPGDKNACV